MLTLDGSNTAVIHTYLRCGFHEKGFLWDSIDSCPENPPQIVLEDSSIKPQDSHQSFGIYTTPKVRCTIRKTCHIILDVSWQLKRWREGGTTFLTYHSEMWIQLWLDMRSAWRGCLDRKQVRNTKVFSNVTGFWKRKGKKTFSNLIHHKVSTHDIILCLYGITGKFQHWYLSEAYAN